MSNKGVKGIYIHIPFCITKCSFCDFSVYALGNKSFKNIPLTYNVNNTDSINKIDHNKEIMNKYVDYLIKEISILSKTIDKKNQIDSIYFGGGTPSLLSLSNLKRIMNQIKHSFNLNINIEGNSQESANRNLNSKQTPKEISIELNPDTFTLDSLNQLKSEAGFTRCTMGIQSLNPDVLSKLNRSHTLETTFSALNILKQSNFNLDYGVDLIQGLPKQHLESVLYDIEYLKHVPHISIYMLTLEKNTPFFKSFNKTYYSDGYSEGVIEMFERAHYLMTENNYSHYEVSNYCKEVNNILPDNEEKLINYNKNLNCKANLESVHNNMYWKGNDYIGFGVSAASLVEGGLIKNPTTINKYFSYVDELKKNMTNISNDTSQLDISNNSMCEYKDSKLFNRKSKELLFNTSNTRIVEVLSNEDVLKYFLMNGIRTKKGVDLETASILYSICLKNNCNYEINEKNFNYLVLFENIVVNTFKEKFPHIKYDIYNDSDSSDDTYNNIDSTRRLRLQFPQSILISDEILVEIFIALKI